MADDEREQAQTLAERMEERALATFSGAVWESDPGRVLARYRALPAPERATHTHLAHAAAALRREEARLAEARRARVVVLWRDDDGILAPEEVLASVEAAVRAVEEERARALGFVRPVAADVNARVEEFKANDDDDSVQTGPSSSGVENVIAGGEVEVGDQHREMSAKKLKTK